jgi:hypothetical protein
LYIRSEAYRLRAIGCIDYHFIDWSSERRENIREKKEKIADSDSAFERKAKSELRYYPLF